MILDGKATRSIARTEDGKGVRILDQRQLPWEVRWVELRSMDEAAVAIREMWTRGAPMVGATAAYGRAKAASARSSGGRWPTAVPTASSAQRRFTAVGRVCNSVSRAASSASSLESTASAIARP